VVDQPVKTTQVAVSSLLALGLNPLALDGVRGEHTQALPGLDLQSARGNEGFVVGNPFQDSGGDGPSGDNSGSDILHGSKHNGSRFNSLFAAGKGHK
jgi:hypothetical protein